MLSWLIRDTHTLNLNLRRVYKKGEIVSNNFNLFKCYQKQKGDWQLSVRSNDNLWKEMYNNNALIFLN